MMRERIMLPPDVHVVGADEADCVGGDNSHTAPDSPLFYSGDASAAVPHKWTQDFVALRPFWVGIVADR